MLRHLELLKSLFAPHLLFKFMGNVGAGAESVILCPDWSRVIPCLRYWPLIGQRQPVSSYK